MSINHLLENLNPAQREGAEAIHGPVLVVAGAGSGKTKMLTTRIAHLMQVHQVAPHHILAVTFTNKAAEEMRTRIGALLGIEMHERPSFFNLSHIPSFKPQIGTFHSICVRILRQEISRTPYTQSFVIYDDHDQLELIKKCLNELHLSEKSFSPKGVQYKINSLKGAAIEPHQAQADLYDFWSKTAVQIYALYQKELFKNQAIDFGEIITLTYRLLRDNPDLLKKYQDLYQYIHIDEYQDTNRAQYLLIQQLARGHRNLCVVGDEDQSIYKWRGADIRNILDFEKDYPDVKIIKLEQNYRSTQTIINASSGLIANNQERKLKTLWTQNERGSLIQRFQCSDERAEAELVISQLRNLCVSDGYAYSDVAIFYRTNAQSRLFEDVLQRSKLPYKIIGGLRFYDRKEIKDIIAYFRFLINPSDGVSLKRIINVPQRSIGKATTDKIELLAIKEQITLEGALHKAAMSDDFSNAPKRKIADFLKLASDLRELLSRKTLSEFYHDLMDSIHYIEELKQENTEEALSRIENLQEFDSTLVEFENSQENVRADALLPLFLENITLASEQDSMDLMTGSVSLMTLHTSKGLEFPIVFLVGLEEGLFPSIRSSETEDEENVEEERRLCYVGMTRAKRRLFLTHARCRRVYGNIFYRDPSRFLQEIPKEYIEFKDLTRSRMYRPDDTYDLDY